MPSLYVIGDSISLQYGPYLKASLEGVMAYDRLSGEEEAFENLDEAVGANGGPTTRSLKVLQAMKTSGTFKTDLFLINCGLHDLKRDKQSNRLQTSLEEYDANLRRIIALTTEMAAQTIWIRTTDINDEIHKRQQNFIRTHKDVILFNETADTVMRELNIPMIDLYHFTRTLGPDTDIFRDHAHFTDEVCRKQGAFIAGWVQGYLASRSSYPYSS